MRNPLWRLKSLPWITLLQAAGLAVAIATVGDILLVQVLNWLLSGVTGGLMPIVQLVLLVLPVAVGYAIGALTLAVMERLFRQVYLDTAVLWALIPCVALVLFLKGTLPLPGFFVAMSYPQLVGVLLGVFVTGKRHWRRW